MTADVWPRLAYLAACCALTAAFAAVWALMGFWPLVCVVAGGALLAVVLSVETDHPKPAAAGRPPLAAALSTNELADELERRARAGDVPVATRRGRPLASVDTTDEAG